MRFYFPSLLRNHGIAEATPNTKKMGYKKGGAYQSSFP